MMRRLDWPTARKAVAAKAISEREVLGNWFSTGHEGEDTVVESIVGFRPGGRYTLLRCHFMDGRLSAAFASHGTYTLEPGGRINFADEDGLAFSQQVEAVRDATGRLDHCRIDGRAWGRSPYDPAWFLSPEAAERPAFDGAGSGGVLTEIARNGGPAMIHATLPAVVRSLSERKKQNPTYR